MQYQAELLIPILGILSGITIPIAVFIWLYFDAKGKRETVLEISKNLNDPSKVEELLRIFSYSFQSFNLKALLLFSSTFCCSLINYSFECLVTIMNKCMNLLNDNNPFY